MALDDALRQRGFRRWYERQLIEAHAYLVTGFLALIMMLVALEVVEFRSSAANLLFLVAVAGAGGVVCVFAWRRFSATLSAPRPSPSRRCARVAPPTVALRWCRRTTLPARSAVGWCTCAAGNARTRGGSARARHH